MDTRIKSKPPSVTLSYNNVKGIERKDRKSAFQKVIENAKGMVGATSGALLPLVALTAPPTVGGAVLTAFVAGASKISGTKGDPLAGQMSSDGVSSWQDRGMQYLMLQMEIQDEARRFTTLSNVIKARHDAAMSAIRNLRG